MTWGSSASLLADKSAWARTPSYRERWQQALVSERLVICAIVHLEMLYSARTRAEIERLDRNLSFLRDLPVTRGTLSAASQAMLALAVQGSDGHHRVAPADAIIAACAAEHGCAVLHYDAHYDRLAEVLAFESIWVAPRGTL